MTSDVTFPDGCPLPDSHLRQTVRNRIDLVQHKAIVGCVGHEYHGQFISKNRQSGRPMAASHIVVSCQDPACEIKVGWHVRQSLDREQSLLPCFLLFPSPTHLHHQSKQPVIASISKLRSSTHPYTRRKHSDNHDSGAIYLHLYPSRIPPKTTGQHQTSHRVYVFVPRERVSSPAGAECAASVSHIAKTS